MELTDEDIDIFLRNFVNPVNYKISDLSSQLEKSATNFQYFVCTQCGCKVPQSCDFVGLCDKCLVDVNKYCCLTGNTLTDKMVIKLTQDYYFGKCSKLIHCNAESSSYKIQKELEFLIDTFTPQRFVPYK